MSSNTEVMQALPRSKVLLDAHCHLSLPSAMPAAAAFIAHARAHGIAGVLLGGSDPTEWRCQQQLEQQYPGFIHPLYGIHPWHVVNLSPELADGWLCQLAELATRARGVGEIGLDLSSPPLKAAYAHQRDICARQLDLAALLSKPVVLHVVRAHQEMLALLRSARTISTAKSPRHTLVAPVIVHGFRGSKQLATQYLDQGIYLSFGPSVLMDGRDEALLRFIPADRLLVESDAPRKRLHPFTGHPEGTLVQDGVRYTTPSVIIAIATILAGLRGGTPIELLQQSTSNLERIFFPDTAAP